MARSRKARSRRKPGPSAAFIVGLTIGAVAVLAVIGLVLSRSFGLPVPAAIPGLGGGVFDVPNPNVTEENYHRLNYGLSTDEVERILGPGRPPSSADFDAIFGRKVEELSMMPLQRNRIQWEEYSILGRVRVWSDGPRYMLVLYADFPNRGKRLASSLYKHADGRVSTSSGGGNWPAPPSAKPATDRKTEAKKRTPPNPNGPVPSVTVEQLLADYAANADAADQKYEGRKVRVSGTIDSVLVSVVMFRTTGARLQAQMNGVATGEIGRKKSGDALAVVGRVKAYFPATAVTPLTVLLEDCSIDD